MHESGVRGPQWVVRLLGRQVHGEAFEPAWHEAHALYLSRRAIRGPAGRRVARLVFRLRTLTLFAQCLWLRVRGGRGDGWVRSFGSELVIAGRGLRKRPGFMLVSGLTLAFGVGATTAIFSVLNGVLLRPLPFEAPRELVTMEIMGPRGYPVSLSLPNLRDWRERNRVFTGFGIVAPWSLTRAAPDGATVLDSYVVGGDFFELLGVRPQIGRWLSAEETEQGSPFEIVLGYGYWQREFAGDPGVLGEAVNIAGRPATIVGVMPEGFGFPRPEIEAYVPMGALAGLPWEDRNSSFGGVPLARLRSGYPLAAAQQDMDRVTQAIEAEEGMPIASTRVITADEYIAGGARKPIWLLMGAALSVLLIAIVNVANLLLSRAEGRRREVAVRVAMGARRPVIVRQLLAEGMAIAFTGLVLGVSVAYGGVSLVRWLVPLPPLASDISIDVAALGFAVTVALIVGVMFGAVPALRGSAGPAAVLRDASRMTDDRSRQTLRSALVVAEVAIALMLTVGAGLMLRSLGRLNGADAGFASRNVITARLRPSAATYPDAVRFRGFYDAVLDRLQAEPGVASASASLLVPLSDRSWELSVQPEGVPFDPGEGESVLYNIVSPEYFTTLSIPILRGRNFERTDRDGTVPVAIIDETMAEKFWPGEDPVGKRIAFEQAQGSTAENPIPVYRTVVGVAPNVRHYDLRTPSRIQVWVPMHQSLRNWSTGLYVVVRTSGDAALLADRLREAVHAVDRSVPVSNVQTMDAYVARQQQPDRAMSGMLAAFGGLALGLAAIGVFGVMSLIVAMRAREIGIRMAVGALPRQILGLVLGRTMLLAGLGTIIGLLGAASLSRLLASFLYEVSPLEPRVYAVAAAFMIGVAVLASVLPAFRATRIDPVRTLQDA